MLGKVQIKLANSINIDKILKAIYIITTNKTVTNIYHSDVTAITEYRTLLLKHLSEDSLLTNTELLVKFRNINILHDNVYTGNKTFIHYTLEKQLIFYTR